VAGERDPVKVAQVRKPGCKATTEQVAQALMGTWQEEPLFILTQALELFDYYTTKLSECDAQLERYVTAMESRGEPEAPLPSLPPVKRDSKSKHQPNFNVRAHLARIIGVDLVAVTGLSASTVQTISSEIGPDMSKFPPVQPFCAWLGLAPHNDISGGKVLRSRTLKVVNRAAQAFRQAAQSGARSDSAFGARDRALRARRRPQPATGATAHTSARVVYHLLTPREDFQAERAAAYAGKRRARELKQQFAACLGLAPRNDIAGGQCCVQARLRRSIGPRGAVGSAARRSVWIPLPTDASNMGTEAGHGGNSA
jgi:transposase